MCRVVAVLFVALAMFAVRSDGAPDVAKMKSDLRNALQQLAANDFAGAMKSVRAVSRCDTVPVAREVKPIGAGRPKQLRRILGLELIDLERGPWWRASMMSQNLAGCYSVTLTLEQQRAFLHAEKMPSSKLT